jgi:hypothetical protein
MDQTINGIIAQCDFGDQRLTRRAVSIGEALWTKYGSPLSTIFQEAGDLKRAYEFFANPKTSFQQVTQPYHASTATKIAELPIVLAVGDTTYLDYKEIREKTSEYGPIGNGGNGLILHSTLAVHPDNGQPLGLLAEKLWHREHQASKKLTMQQKKKMTFKLKPFYGGTPIVGVSRNITKSKSQDAKPKAIPNFRDQKRPTHSPSIFGQSWQ